MRWLDSIFNSIDMDLSKLQEIVEDRGAWLAVVHGVAKSWTVTEQQHEWEEYSSYFGEGVGTFRHWATAHILAFMVLASVGVSFNVLMCYNEHILSTIWDLAGSNQLMSCPWAMPFF